jgi:TonB family protein
VVVSLQVFADGSAHNIEISESSGWQGLDDAAIRTVATSWGFSPATTRSGVPVVSSKQVAVRFQLDPPVQPSTDLSIPQQVGLVLISYFTFQHSSNAVLDACTRRGVDTAAARAQWTAGNGATAEKVAAFQRYLDGKKGQIPDYTQNAMPMAQQYELHIKLEDLRSGDAAKAQTRCQRVVESFKQGKETFERFDPESYQNLSKIKL